MLRIKRLYATICALLVIQATYWTIIIIKKKKKALISYARISYYKQVKKKGAFFFPSSKVQTNRQIAHVHKDLPLPTSSTAITKKPP